MNNKDKGLATASNGDVEYGVRIVIEKEFFESFTEDIQKFHELKRELGFIQRTSSLGRRHVLMPQSDLDEFIENNPNLENHIVFATDAATLPEDGDTRLESVIELAIGLSGNPPYNTYIFTAEDRYQKFENSEKLEGVEGGVKIADPQEARQVIDYLHPDRDSDKEAIEEG